MEKIFLSSPHLSGLERLFIDEVLAVGGLMPLGPQVDAFEKETAAMAGVRGALALSSGTAAIHLALRLLGVGPGDRVFCSSFTFIASANPVLYLGGEPVFIDSEPDSWNMSPQALERAFLAGEKAGRLPKAVVAVSLYGQSADMDPILKIAGAWGVPVVEDAAESLGATYKGRASGSLGCFGIYSYNGNKMITTSGGGMLISNDLEKLEKARFLSTQARDQARHYQHSEMGYNYRMSNLLAAVGRGQLPLLAERVRARREVFARYHQALAGIQGVEFMPEASFGRSTRWLTVLTMDPEKCGVTPAAAVDELAKAGIESRPAWKPLHLQPLFKDCLFYSHRSEESDGSDPQGSVCGRIFATGLCLPSSSCLSKEDQERVIHSFRLCLRNGKGTGDFQLQKGN